MHSTQLVSLAQLSCCLSVVVHVLPRLSLLYYYASWYHASCMSQSWKGSHSRMWWHSISRRWGCLLNPSCYFGFSATSSVLSSVVNTSVSSTDTDYRDKFLLVIRDEFLALQQFLAPFVHMTSPSITTTTTTMTNVSVPPPVLPPPVSVSV